MRSKSAVVAPERVELFRTLGDAGRLRLLAMCAEEELSVGELAEILSDSQPQISRRAAPLRQLGLLVARREGTKTFLRVAEDAREDRVIEQAIIEGRRLAMLDGSLARVPSVVAAREQASDAFFDIDSADHPSSVTIASDAPPLLAHLAALSPLLPANRLAVDVGCGDGALLEILGPLFERVIAIDRSPAQLARAAERIRQKHLSNIRLFNGRYDDAALLEEVDASKGADLVYASRVLHHASRPSEAMRSFARLLSKTGHLLVVDYLPHNDEKLREQGDVWLGFAPEELDRLVLSAGLHVVSHGPLPQVYAASGPDAHLHWQVLVAGFGKKS